jgi:hypothetical protein
VVGGRGGPVPAGEVPLMVIDRGAPAPSPERRPSEKR